MVRRKSMVDAVNVGPSDRADVVSSESAAGSPIESPAAVQPDSALAEPHKSAPGRQPETLETHQVGNVTTLQDDSAAALKIENVSSASVSPVDVPLPPVRRRRSEAKTRLRVEMPHVSLYLVPAVIRKVRDIAHALDCKPHDIYVEGLRRMFAEHGLNYDEVVAQWKRENKGTTW